MVTGTRQGVSWEGVRRAREEGGGVHLQRAAGEERHGEDEPRPLAEGVAEGGEEGVAQPGGALERGALEAHVLLVAEPAQAREMHLCRVHTWTHGHGHGNMEGVWRV